MGKKSERMKQKQGPRPTAVAAASASAPASATATANPRGNSSSNSNDIPLPSKSLKRKKGAKPAKNRSGNSADDISNLYDPHRTQFPVLSYDEDCDVYFVNIENMKNKQRGVADGEEMGWNPADVILEQGAFVECIGLEKARHLNGKRAWLEDYDEGCERHCVWFEDTHIKKSILATPGNLRLLFFGKEHESSAREDNEE
mmetsp:Transcript_15157/g.27406  ORF Transcript_15157/g.27406 Transcript_15157/m.27406 type:complete len:200 (-) Transcript_15157:217-816(-)